MLEKEAFKAKQAQQRQNDMIIYSAHDIKTPLTSIMGYLILLDSDPHIPIDERKKYIGIALEKTRRLDGMTNEFFEMTRLGRQDIILEKTQIDLYSMLIQMKEEFYPLLKSGKRQVTIQASENLSIHADPEMLARVFSNILKNAIAYSDPGSTINISARESRERLEIRFENSGRAIPEEELNLIFEQFYRSDSSRSFQTGVSGLGLAISKEIISLHGGAIEVQSEEGRMS